MWWPLPWPSMQLPLAPSHSQQGGVILALLNLLTSSWKLLIKLLLLPLPTMLLPRHHHCCHCCHCCCCPPCRPSARHAHHQHRSQCGGPCCSLQCSCPSFPHIHSRRVDHSTTGL